MVALALRPGHEKDLEIQQLQLTLQERDRMQATKDVLCTSLTEEVEQLKLQLGATVRVCQGLLRRFDREKQRSDLVQSLSCLPEGGKLVESQASPQASSMENKLKEENQLLRQRVAYVESLNAKWQKYDSSREEYVKALCLKLKEVSPQAALGLAPANGGLLQQEIARLNRLLEEKMADCSRLSRELEEVRREDHERIQMLEQQVRRPCLVTDYGLTHATLHPPTACNLYLPLPSSAPLQVLTYVDDFNSERADRERAQSRIQSLQEKVDHLQQQLHGQVRAPFQPPEVPPVLPCGRCPPYHNKSVTATGCLPGT
ncbi:hypothetical protein Z043_111170 [Scleropages formosus]|uniref:TSG101 and ALIX binding domain-containing protein n=1 Tax=Scleropages formosus TaxID=113540 RepID=A0A0N8JZR0_SCLFO|nr:hypothetical protein Z043_111170 [Scleropages formosus]